MKCKVVEDLLPLYIDNVCNQESKVLIEEHLKTCPKCSDLFKIMSENLQNDNTLHDQININLKEKDLLLKAKENIKFDFSKKILKLIYKSIIILNILAIIADYFIIRRYLEYPRFFFGSLGLKSYIILLITLILPIISSILGLFIINSINYNKAYKLKNILSIISILVCILLSTASSFIIIQIPPLESFTNSPKNYLKTGNDMLKYEDIYKEFFPENIPTGATNIIYSYRKYDAIFETSVNISASWTLPKDSYENYKQLVKNKFKMYLIENNKYEIKFTNITNDPYYLSDLKLIFEYNDETNELIYTAIIEN